MTGSCQASRRLALVSLAALAAAAVFTTTSCGGDQMQSQTTGTTGGSAVTSTGSSQTTTGLPYPIVDSGQILCYNATTEIDAPAPGADFYGQDAQYEGNQPSYTKSADGLTVTDNVTGLVWQQTPDTNGDGVIDVADKMTWDEAQKYPATLNAKKFGGFDDWRLPTIKELYSLIDFSGTDPSRDERHDSAGLVALHRHRLLRLRLWRHQPPASASSIRSTPRARRTSRTTMSGRRDPLRRQLRRWPHQGLRPQMPDRERQDLLRQCVRGNPATARTTSSTTATAPSPTTATGLMWVAGRQRHAA